LDVDERLSEESGYYVISDVDDFKQLLAFGQNGSLKFRLINDINLATEPDLYIPYFAGEFDGNSHKISNLNFKFDFVSQIGLFGYLAPGGNVAELATDRVSITGASTVGGLIGDNLGKISNSYSTGNIIGDRDVGGLVGDNWGTVSNSYFTGTVTGTVGYLSQYIGGLVGRNEFEGTVSSSYSTNSVTGGADVGGLAGESFGNVSKSYSLSNVTGESRVGGLVGQHGGSVSDSYSAGSVTGNEDIGGLVGANNAGGTVSDSFWDIQTSGQSTSDGGVGKTTAEMRNVDTFSGAGWNITTVADSGTRNTGYLWNIVDGVTYPFLSWQP
jgi:hypothetical protein